MKLIIFFLFLVFLSCADADEQSRARKIQSHLSIQDAPEAVLEARSALKEFPHSSLLHENYIRALASAGDEKRMIQAWESYQEIFSDEPLNRVLIEEMAWGVLTKASFSSSLVMRQMALLAAFFSQEAKGIAVLKAGMRDSNHAIRAMAVKLGGHFRDHQLSEEVRRLYKEEKVWSVRQHVLEAAGKMKIRSLRSDLEGLIASEDCHPAEKVLAITALVNMIEDLNRTEIDRLATSRQLGLRQLACRAIAHFQIMRDLDCLLLLARDPNPNVRWEACQAIGQLRPKVKLNEILQLARQGSSDPNCRVASSAAWLLTLYCPQEGMKAFEHLLQDDRKEERVIAAAALRATGKYGIEYAIDQFRLHPDPFVKFNLALGLIGQRQCTSEALSYIKEMVLTEKGKWSSLEEGIFQAVTNTSQNRPDSMLTPEMQNQLLRLEMLNLIAIIRPDEAQVAIRHYLSERQWEISAAAAALLLTEGDEAAIDIVKQLLEDPQPRIRLQAALILSLWSREERAIQTLQEEYALSDWELKARILEGLGRIGSMISVPFLINVLKEPSQTLRLIGAMALIQCLNH